MNKISRYLDLSTLSEAERRTVKREAQKMGFAT